MADKIPAEKIIASRWGWLGLLILIIAGVFQIDKSGIVDLNLNATSTNQIDTYYKVTKVTDGDTIHIDMDGTDETIRLIGINTPETVDPRKTVECFGKEASTRMKELLSGKIVRLEYDESQSSRDVYGRLLAYVYIDDGEMINRKMIAEGYAYEYTYMTPYKYQTEFRSLQNIAKTSKRGLWAEDACNGQK
ncbi:MAG: Micrococcal nuclease [Candidatus Nomurabacteria bacterium]|nr:Micrococcal nuclease [Candidatus Nomurabacteria bacterium]